MSSDPLVSLVVPAYNESATIEQVLRRTSELPFRRETLVVDDGSVDGSGAIIDSFAARDPRIRAIHQPNRGLVASLNLMIAEARAPLIARMDGDDVSLPTRFERQLDFLEANPDYGVVGTSTHDIDEQGRLNPNLDFHPLDHESFLAALETGPWLCHPSAILQTRLLREVGGYRAAFRHCEDYDLWLRLSERTRLCTIPDRLFHYRRSENQVSNAYVLEQLSGAAIAYAAHCERVAGRPDPTHGLDRLPPIAELDGFFGRAGVARQARSRVAPRIVYSTRALTGPGFPLLLDHVREGGDRAGLWRTAARLMKLRSPGKAFRLAAALAAR